ncbi:MAG: restriction endonuclease subunit S [Desulfobulbaceae bacterium]
MKVAEKSGIYNTSLDMGENIGDVTIQTEWPELPISHVADVNPRVNKSSISDDLPVSFVPMPAVGAGDGSIHVEETRLAGEVKKGFTAFQEGDVLFAKITPCMENGKMAVVPKLVNGYGFGSTEFHVLRPKIGMDAKYLYYYVSSQNFRSEAERSMTGAVGQRRVPTTYLKEVTIPVAPFEQQKRIVAEIEKQFSRLDEAVANLKRVKAKLKRYKAAVLKAAVEGKLTEEWRKQHPDVEPASKLLELILAERRKKWEEAELAKMKAKGNLPKDDKWKEKYKEPKRSTTDLSSLPAGWVWVNLELLKEFSLYGPRFSSIDYSEKGIHVLRTSDINESGKVNTKTTPKLDLDDIQYEKYKINKGDLLITRTGSLGTLAVYNDDVRAIPGAYLIRYRLAAEHHTSWFLFYFFKSPLGLKQIIKGGAGVGRPNLNAPTIEDIKTPFPPSAEQKEIIRKIEGVLTLTEKLKTQVEDNLLRAERLRQSILMNAFQDDLCPEIISSMGRAE